MSQSEALSPQLFRVSLAVANTEYSQALPVGTKFFEIRNPSASDVRLAFVSGKVGPSTEPYFTIKAGTTLRGPEKLGWRRGT